MSTNTVPVGMLRVAPNVRRLVLTTLWALTRFSELRPWFTEPLPALAADKPVPCTMQQALLAVVQQGLGDEPSLAVAVLDQLGKPATDTMHTRPTSARQAHAKQFATTLHSRQASIASRKSNQAHSRDGSMAISPEDLRAAARAATKSADTRSPGARASPVDENARHRTESGLTVGLATAGTC